MKTREVALGATIAALYAVGVIVLAPISFMLLQVRIADALIPLSILFGMPAVLGVTVGAAVANVFGGLGYVDIIGGSLANLVAGYVGWRVGSMRFSGSRLVATIAQNILVSTIVGSYLALLFNVPLEVGFVGVFLGSVISMNIIGYALVLAIARSGLRTRLEPSIREDETKPC